MRAAAQTIASENDYGANRLLAALGRGERALIEPHLVLKLVGRGQVLFEPGEDVETTYFPCRGTMGSLLVVSSDGVPVAASDRMQPDHLEKLSAITSGLIALAYGAAQIFDGGAITQALVTMEHGTLVIMAIDAGSSLAVLTTAAAPRSGDLDLAPLRAKWGWILALGIVYLVVGIIALGNVLMATAASVLVLGVMMVPARRTMRGENASDLTARSATKP